MSRASDDHGESPGAGRGLTSVEVAFRFCYIWLHCH